MFAMHAADSNLPEGNWFVPSVHGSGDVILSRTKGFGKVGSQVHLKLRQPVLVIFDTKWNTSSVPMLVSILDNGGSVLDGQTRRGLGLLLAFFRSKDWLAFADSLPDLGFPFSPEESLPPSLP